ncbi:endonuclease/exonuclease/phosphatase family protein [Toxoplasma gondii VEG]|nr:endonuclease/exonuclease/phosphatase family protein [Toxoplasma gondii VEG]
MTYNILHKLDARRAKFFSYSQPANLQSETRLARVRDELRDLQPHVACLQEVERESLSHLTSQLECDAYACAASLFNDKSGVSDGCALLYKKSILEVVRTHAFHFASLVDDFFPNQKAARDHMALAFWRRLKEKRNLAVVASFRVKATGQIVHVCSTHLFWDPRQPEVKLMQAFLLARALRRYADEQERTREEEREEKTPECTQRNDTDAGDERVTKEETNESRNEATTRKVNVETGEWTREEVPETDQKINHEITHEIKQAREQEREQGREERSSAGLVRDAPLIVGGDFNSMPFQSVTKVSGPEGREKGKEMCVENKYHSGVYQLFTEGLVLPSHPEHPVSFHPSLAADAVPPLTIFPFQSAYKEVLGEEPRFTNYTRDFQGCLDYLFFRNATVKAVLSIPDDCELKREVALPNSRFPSDHVALMADFVLR